MSRYSAAQSGVFLMHLRHQPASYFNRCIALYDRLAPRFYG